MTNSPNSGNEPESNVAASHRRLWVIWVRRGGLTLSVVLLVSVLGSMAAIWLYVQRQLAPLVQKNLTETLNRPVQLGKVEGFSFTGALRFGPSAVPQTPTDPDHLAVKAVDVAFDPLKLLFTRTLQLEVTLIDPDVYVEQDVEGRWVSTAIKSEEKKGPIQTELQGIRVKQAKVVLVPYPEAGRQKGAIALTQVNGAATFREKNQRISFDLAGIPVNGGNLRIKGENRPAAQQTNLSVAGQNLLAADVSRLLKLKGVDLQAGRLDGNVDVQLRPEQAPLLAGTAAFQAATVKIAQIPQLLTNTTGQLGFKGTEIQLQNISTIYGQIPGLVNGALDTEAGYNISAQTVPIGLANILNTFNLKLPVTAAAEAQAAIKITGRPNQPVVSGTLVTTKRSQVDRIEFRSIQTNFQLVGTTLTFNRIQALPTVGGQVSGNGRIKLGDKGGVVFDLQGENLPGDTLALLYGNKSGIRIGRVSAKGQVFGPTGNLQTVLQVAAPSAIYPTTGEVIITPANNVLFRNITLQVGDGTVNGSGQVVDGRWQA
jgi:translocation and assembly module TamB